MKHTIFLVFFFLAYSFQTQANSSEGKSWLQCQQDSDCALARERACAGFCYNKQHEKEAFAWEEKIVWDCMPLSNNIKKAKCQKKHCVCVNKK